MYVKNEVEFSQDSAFRASSHAGAVCSSEDYEGTEEFGPRHFRYPDYGGSFLNGSTGMKRVRAKSKRITS